jgi:FkbM family methyltransferase
MNKLYDRFERKALIGNSKLQWLFESLHRFSLRGMNYNQVTAEDSGEQFVINYLQKKLSKKNEIVLFDVGANIGEYSKALVNRFPKSRIYSFEALPSTFEILKNNLLSDKNIICINKALGNQRENRLIYTDGAGSGLTSFYPIESSKKTEMVSTSMITIDSFCQENNVEQIDFLKIDVEGFELEVLKGGKQMIESGKILNIQFEFGGTHINSETSFHKIFQFLSNYDISRVLKNGLRGYPQYSVNMEIYLSANYFAEIKQR